MPFLILFAGSVAAQEVLPFPAPPIGGKLRPTMQESVHKWREQVRHLPEDAPNILIVMLDDAGFGQASTFGGAIETPTLSRLANEGISYNAFHTTAMCSPTRAALLTGRNHNRVGFGQIAECGGRRARCTARTTSLRNGPINTRASSTPAGTSTSSGASIARTEIGWIPADTKLIAADFGGTRTPMVISWPERIKPDKTPRPQFHHVNDVVPTIYEILGIQAPKIVDSKRHRLPSRASCSASTSRTCKPRGPHSSVRRTMIDPG